MAQRALAAVLRRTLDSWAEEAELDAQLLAGEVQLSKAKLRPVTAPFGLCCSGTLGQLSAHWSWRSLLSSPVVVKVKEVLVVIRPQADLSTGPSSNALRSAGKPVSQEALDPSSMNFFQRMTHRIWEQLQLEVSAVHVRFEYPDVAASAASAASCCAAGLFVGHIAIAVDRDRQQGAVLQQTVSIEDLGAYIDPQPEAGTFASNSGMLEREVPPRTAFIAQGLSPCCRAVRHSGRRFADWRGLEVSLDFNKPSLSCTHEQYRGLLRLSRFLEQQCEECPARTAAASEEDGWHDAVEERVVAPAPAEPQSSWWSSWFSSRKQSNSRPFPEGISPEDQELLLAEDAPPQKLATFELDIQLRDASLAAKDLLLHFDLSSGLHISCGVEGWTASCALSSLCVSEMIDGELVQVCSRGSGGATSVPQISLSAQSTDKLEISLAIAPLNVHISPLLLASVNKFMGVTRGVLLASFDYDIASQIHKVSALARGVTEAWTVETERPQQLSPGASASAARGSSSWALKWRMEGVTISVGGPWLRGAWLLFAAEAEGSAHSGGVQLAEVAVAADLVDEQGRRRLLDRSSFSIGFEESKVVARSQSLTARCALHELVALVRAGRAFQAGFQDGAEVPVPDPAPRGKELEVLVEQVSIEILDEASASYAASARGLASRIVDGQAVTTAGDCELLVRAGGEERAVVRLTVPSICSNFRSQCNCSIQTAVEIWDKWDQQAELAALHCPCLQAAFSWALSDSSAMTASLELRPASVHLAASEAFVTACARGLAYAADVAAALGTEAVTFEERPLGLQILDAKVLAVSGAAERLGVRVGSVVCGVEPAGEGEAMERLQVCALPVTLLLEPPPRKLRADVLITPFTLNASLRTTKRTIEVAVDKADVRFEGFQVHDWLGTPEELAEEVKAFYVKSLMKELPWLISAASIGGQRLSQAAAGAVGSSLAVLRFGGAAAGAVGATLAQGVTAFAAASAAKGREARGAEDKSYRFGDVTRGFLLLSCERGRRVRGAFDDRPDRALSSKAADVAVGSVTGAAAYAWEARAVSSTLGAALGGSLGAVAGPAGVAAGAAAGGAAGGSLSRTVESAGALVGRSVSGTLERGRQSRGEAEGGYQFGDLTRGILAAGREARGGEVRGEYKFGDFSRGLLSRLGRR